jgi:hypothetical protein
MTPFLYDFVLFTICFDECFEVFEEFSRKMLFKVCLKALVNTLKTSFLALLSIHYSYSTLHLIQSLFC